MIKSDKIRHKRKETKVVKASVNRIKMQNAERKEMIANAMIEKYSTHRMPQMVNLDIEQASRSDRNTLQDLYF